MMEHSPVPWVVAELPTGVVEAHSGDICVCRAHEPEDVANLRRVVACVNALHGISTTSLEMLEPGDLQDVLFKWALTQLSDQG